MTREEILKIWPQASEATIQRNLKNTGTPVLVLPSTTTRLWKCGKCGRRMTVCDADPEGCKQAWPEGLVVEHTTTIERFYITIRGQIKGGKNNMIVTRTGLHFPKPEWAKWRDQAVAQVKAQLPHDWRPRSEPTNIRLEYIAGDKRRRDMPAIIDSIFHVFEKAGVCTDDTHLWVSESSRGYDKEKPRAVITFL